MEKSLKAKILGIAEGKPEVIINVEDLKEMGLYPNDRVKVSTNHKIVSAIAGASKDFIAKGTVGISLEVVQLLNIQEGDHVIIAPGEKPRSVEYIKKKMDKQELTEEEFKTILYDIISNNLSKIELTAFVSALHINDMTVNETIYLAKQLAQTGAMLRLKQKPILDKHSLGGVPGNKVTLLIVPIAAAAGLTIPKTSSRAITSACGTADIMEVLAPVTFNVGEIAEIVNKTNGIIAWGGGANLAPADDELIKIEYPLSLNPHSLAIASVMAKKLAVGAEYVVIDIPIGTEAKVKTMDEAKRFAYNFIKVGEGLGINIECAITYGDKPIGRAIGPALEAREALTTLQGEGPASLIEKSAELAGILLEVGRVASKGEGKNVALKYLTTGKALAKMREIIGAQGGDPNVKSENIQIGEYSQRILSPSSGFVTHISNRAITKIARSAGSPKDIGAGILLHVTKGTKVEKNDVLFEIYAEHEYKLTQALKLAEQMPPVILEGMLLKRIPEYTIFEY